MVECDHATCQDRPGYLVEFIQSAEMRLYCHDHLVDLGRLRVLDRTRIAQIDYDDD